MDRAVEQKVAEAFNSMLRTDYISLNDVDKLNLLSQYFVDYFGYLPQILAESDQLLVGRRGTGKTTLIYRAFVECMRSWQKEENTSLTGPQTLGIYIDLSKCHSLESTAGSFSDFEHVFVTELCDSISQQLTKFWPALSQQPTLFNRIFRAVELKQASEAQKELDKLAHLLQEGLPRLTKFNTRGIEETTRNKASDRAGISANLDIDKTGLAAELSEDSETEATRKTNITETTTYRLSIADILRTLQNLREKANISAIYVFIDEFSSLSNELQGRFTTLLRKILGTHSGVFIKLCAITDNYSLGSSIILQRDLFEISLDLDGYVERCNSLNQAMGGLKEQAERIVVNRLEAYKCPSVEALFDSPEEAWELLSLQSMGVPRTLGIVLQQAWNRRRSEGASKLRKSDVDYGIRYASKAYLNQMLGASKDGVAIPAHVIDLWYALLDRATEERKKEGKAASHFLVLPKHEEVLKYLNMFFLVHLLTQSRTTKKDKASRSLYCFDYGICVENNLDYTTDKNILRQQRFAYDDTIMPYEIYYSRVQEPSFICEQCKKIYKESEIKLGSGSGTLKFCPDDRADLRPHALGRSSSAYTEEEIKIIGAIRSASSEDHLIARQVADDVGCYVQKVAKFGEKLGKEQVISREKDEIADKYIYFDKEE